MPVVDGLPASERRRHIPPRDTTTGPPEHPVKHRAVIGPPATATRDLVGQQRFQTSPFRIGQSCRCSTHRVYRIQLSRSAGHALADVRKPSTIRRRLASISVAHQVAGFETPTADAGVRAVWSGIRRRQGMAPRKMRAARTKVITAMVAPLGDGLADARDRTLLLFGFAGALRRSELVALDVEDVSEDDGGLRLVLRRSKTDQEAEGTTRGLPYGSHPATCPVRAWRRWLDSIGHRDRPGVPVRRAATATSAPSTSATGPWPTSSSAGRSQPASPATFAGHSLRAGFATEGYAQGTPELAIMRHGRWRSASVMRGYVEEGSIWNDNAAARLGLWKPALPFPGRTRFSQAKSMADEGVGSM